MIGFVCAISSALAIVILITVSSLLAYVESLMPTTGLVKISETHYRYFMGNVFIKDNVLNELAVIVDNIESHQGITVTSYKPACNFGFNRSEREMREIATFNFLQVNKFYSGSIDVLNTQVQKYENGINFCHIDINFSSNIKGE